LVMGGGNHPYDELIKKIQLPEKDFQRILDALVYKGQVAIIKDEQGNDVYHIMTIFPGWFELFLMRGEKNADTILFAERVEELFESAYRLGNEEIINQSMRDVGAHIKVLASATPTSSTIKIDKKLPQQENQIFATKSILDIFDKIEEDETIAVGHCFCRFEKELVGDHCRADMPMDTCISIGPGAEHVIKQGIARKITKSEAIAMIKTFQDKGAIHQATRIIPLKDFQAKYPIDIFCNCCWDCCGIIGNYNRGYLPYVLKTFHRAIISDIDKCTGCGECVKFCPVRAITLDENELAVINDELCIGCGQCHHHCDFDVIELIEDERDLFLPILDKDHARITPKDFDDDDDDLVIDDSTPSDRAKVLEVLEETRQKFTREDNVKTFKKWTKAALYYFTDLDEYFHFYIKEGVPDSIKEGKIDNPDIFYTLSGAVFIGLMRGEIDGFKAFRKKLVKIKASVKDMIKLQKLID
ncbi:MAG: 4Fe-4S binding protein, partial [Candidatus Heimdallarchaeota archaeon]